jgi:hypothetical protein
MEFNTSCRSAILIWYRASIIYRNVDCYLLEAVVSYAHGLDLDWQFDPIACGILATNRSDQVA